MEPIFVTYGYRVGIGEMLPRVGLEAGTEEAADFAALAEAMFAVAEACLEAGEGGPGAVYARAGVEYVGGGGRVVLAGEAFFGVPLARGVLGAEWVYPHLVTCGCGLEAWADAVTNPLERYWADEMLRCVLDGVAGAVRVDIAGRFGEAGLGFFGPGSVPGWGLEGHRGVFSLLGSGAAALGVVLRDDLTLRPLKSLSGILCPVSEGGACGGCRPGGGGSCSGGRPGCAGGGCGRCCGKRR